MLFYFTFLRTLDMVSTVCNQDCAKQLLTYDFDNELWPIVRTGWDVLDFPQRQHSIDHFAENYVFPVQEIAFCRGDEELEDKW